MLKNRIVLNRLRVDQNGSLVAPLSLRDAFERHARAEIDDAELRQHVVCGDKFFKQIVEFRHG